MAATDIKKLDLKNGEKIEVDLITGQIKKISTSEAVKGIPFSNIQLEIYQRGGLLE
jgi:predicted DNA-binding antitoxin AbrB/MazE fold protein